MDNQKKTIYLNSLFGKLSGKQKLEKRIDELQSYIMELEIESQKLQRRLEKKEKNAKRAISEKQEAEEKLNAANVKIETLQNEIKSLKEERDDLQDIKFRNIEVLHPSKFHDLISKIQSFKSNADTLITAYLKPDDTLSNLKNPNKLLDSIDDNTKNLLSKIESSTGCILFYDTDHLIRETIVPPLPVTESGWEIKNEFQTGQLNAILEQNFKICVLQIHAGESFVGIANPDEFENYSVVKSSVKAKHKKGGFSQKRFEELRNEDITHHIEKVESEFERMMDGIENDVDYIITGGDRELTRHVLKNINTKSPVIEKPMDSKIEKYNLNNILKNALSCRRYQI
ncbi:Vms1/Ankzf1 family peptidyl-tRNA hydrolase [Methanohalobium sp.]|uniref:Vms1/Ankzf1 family peptidyl-tRNA hydrolase n=1 Tax=Methanohalobium sp. TaxID=2837493 RepID=UPI0025FB5BCC|nr:Vms1/Ankzf1 family peptidyl-tRNA hydrolase [Methanohalobium sp.]